MLLRIANRVIHFVRSFREHYSESPKFCLPTRQEALRFASVNGENITAHLVNLEKLLEKYQFDAEEIWNLEDTGATLGDDVGSKLSSHRILRFERSKDQASSNLHRVTAMPVVSAA